MEKEGQLQVGWLHLLAGLLAIVLSCQLGSLREGWLYVLGAVAVFVQVGIAAVAWKSARRQHALPVG